jgi:hypothetical protein
MFFDDFLNQRLSIRQFAGIVAELHFFEVEIELIAANAVAAFQAGLCIALDVLHAVDVMTLAYSKCLLMADAIIFEPSRTSHHKSGSCPFRWPSQERL